MRTTVCDMCGAKIEEMPKFMGVRGGAVDNYFVQGDVVITLSVKITNTRTILMKKGKKNISAFGDKDVRRPDICEACWVKLAKGDKSGLDFIQMSANSSLTRLTEEEMENRRRLELDKAEDVDVLNLDEDDEDVLDLDEDEEDE